MHIDNLEYNTAEGEQGDESPPPGSEREREREEGGDGEVPDEYGRYYPDVAAEYSVNGTGHEEYV